MDDGNCPVTVQDVVDLLHAKHAIITGKRRHILFKEIHKEGPFKNRIQ